MFVRIKYYDNYIIINIKYIKFITHYTPQSKKYVLFLDGFVRNEIIIDEEDYKKIEKIIGEQK